MPFFLLLASSPVPREPGCFFSGSPDPGFPHGRGQGPPGLHHGHEQSGGEGRRLPPPRRHEEQAGLEDPGESSHVGTAHPGLQGRARAPS